jgi:hypothetical protein
MLGSVNDSRALLALGFAAALPFAARGALAQGDQSNVISQHGDALARSTSAEELVAPMPAEPPNTSPALVQPAAPKDAEPADAAAAMPPRVIAPMDLPSGSNAPVPAAPGAAASSALTDANSGSAAPAAIPQGRSRGILIAAGALLALAMFLWERRRKG